MTKVLKPPFVRNGAWYLPDVTEDDFEHCMVLVPHIFLIENDRVSWIDITATWEWFETGDCSFRELHILTKMLDGCMRKGLRSKRYKKMLQEQQEIDAKIVAACRRLIEKQRDVESNVVSFRKN